MFQNRKLMLLLLVLMLSFSLLFMVGCGGQEDGEQPAENAQQEQEAPVVDSAKVVKDAADKYFAKMPEHSYKISEDDTKALLDSGELADYLVIDVRDAETYGKGHIQGAINVPYTDIGENLDLIAANAKAKKGVLVVCFTGQTAGQATAALNMLGISTRSINLGMTLGWEAKGYPVVTDVTEAAPAEAFDWVDKAPIKEAVENYFEKMPSGMYGSYKIGLDELKAELDASPEKYVIVDVRGHEEYAKGTIKGAIDVPFKEVNQHFDEIAELAKGKTVVVACFTGQTAGQTDTVLNLIGIKTVSLHRGINAGWVDEKDFELTQQ